MLLVHLHVLCVTAVVYLLNLNYIFTVSIHHISIWASKKILTNLSARDTYDILSK